MKIVVGVDGSEHSKRAVAWCAKYGGALEAEVIAVHALEVPVYAWRLDVFAPPLYSEEDHQRVREVLRDEWCKQLVDGNVPFKAVVVDGYPATEIIELAYREKADLVVAGRRGLGGFKELMLGSTSHHLSHHLTLPLVIVP
jgi:nucleotide-binding universal stress UspA family protein